MIDPRAIIDPSARIGEDVEIGPWTIIGPDVELGDHCSIAAHAVLKGPARLGCRNRIFEFAVLGEVSPDFGNVGEPAALVIGDDNVVREGVTIHRGTVQDDARTAIGDRNLFMAHVHIDHGCIVGDHAVIGHHAGLGAHVEVGDWANLGAHATVSCGCNIGPHSMIGAMSLVREDVPAFVSARGNPACAVGINDDGLQQRGFTAEAVREIQEAYRLVYESALTVEGAIEQLREISSRCSSLSSFVDSIARSNVGIVRAREGAGRG